MCHTLYLLGRQHSGSEAVSLLLLFVFVISLFMIFVSNFMLFFRQFYFCFFSVFLILIQLLLKYFISTVLFCITFLQVLVHWCAYDSRFVVLIQASTISLAWVSGWTMTDYLFSAGWRLFKHLLSSATESEAVHCSFHYLISLQFELTSYNFTFHCEMQKIAAVHCCVFQQNNIFQYFIYIDTKYVLVVNFRSVATHTQPQGIRAP